MSEIYILGSLNMDLSILSPRIPDKGETITGSAFKTCPGGKGLNQAIAASKMGGVVHFLGEVGKDSFGKEMIDELKKNKVDCSLIKENSEVSSGIAIIVREEKDNRIILDLGANLKIDTASIDSFLSTAKKDDIFLTQGENNLGAIKYAISKAKEKEMIVVFNPAPANKEFTSFIKDCTYIIPNETEYFTLNGSNNYFEASKKLGANRLIVTLGEKGFLYIDENGSSFSKEAIKVSVLDTTGAGDEFCGSFVTFISQKEETLEALVLASTAASISTTRLGSSSSSITRDELNDYISSLK